MNRIDRLSILAKKKNRVKRLSPKIIEYLKYFSYESQCDYTGEPITREPPKGYKEWLNSEIELHEPTDNDDPSYWALYEDMTSRAIDKTETENKL